MILKDSLYIHGLNLLPQFGPARLAVLAKNFGTFKEAFEASEKRLVAAGIDPEIAKTFSVLRDKINLEQEAEKLENEGIGILTFRDASYPKLLLEIPKFPPLLYYKGKMDEPEELCIAVVGTRQITNYGRTVIPQLVEPLVEAGATIVSGMAFGVDSASHEIAIKKDRRTIAVLGGGLDEKSLYPKHHALLAKQILDAGGALLSEYPMGTPNFKQNFVARNRIISGLSVATLIIECDLESGTLITAKHALDQNRQVYAVPGPIYSLQSQGPNNLLKMGAKPITTANDILEDLNLQTLPQAKEAQSLFGDTKEESTLLKLLTFEPVIVNELIKQSGLDASSVTSTLTFLEMKGKVKNLGGQQYVLSR
ncbi:MAG TPA: DNA-processing protein DprA [Candidatus Limnocylindria bacterium]|nr:DNA-processing protein DprA [Candidatus Limnocylindria bacterium]